MPSRIFALAAVCLFTTSLYSQSPAPYPNAVIDRFVHPKTTLAPPPVNTVFSDPDFGSSMVRVSDENTNPRHSNLYVITEGSGAENTWSADDGKFYVIAEGGTVLAFGFDPQTMHISSLPGAGTGGGLILPLRPGTFSYQDADVLYGTTNENPLTISRYQFSSAVKSTVIDTTTCGTTPPLIPGPGVTSGADDVSVTADDTRFSISEGGPQFGKDMFIVVFDTKLGCRWYNTQTGQVGGKWGVSGTVSTSNRFLINHAFLSKDGNYVRIVVDNGGGKYIWNVATAQVDFCVNGSPSHCAGYETSGSSHLVNAAGFGDEMNILIRPLGNFASTTQLVSPLPSPPQFGIEKHFSWTNANASDTNPVCASTYRYEAYGLIQRPWDAEIICLETDGQASTIWRFAHNRASADLEYFNTQPLGNISPDGKFFLFTSDWDEQLGIEESGRPRSDAWIVKLQ